MGTQEKSQANSNSMQVSPFPCNSRRALQLLFPPVEPEIVLPIIKFETREFSPLLSFT